MKYKELQAKALELGMDKVVAVPRATLEAFIASKSDEPKNESSDKTPVVPNVSESSNESSEQPKEEPKEKVSMPKGSNVAVVKINGNEIRKYTLRMHGEEFAELAQSFANKNKGAVIEFVKYEKGVVCPSCGHEFHP